MGQTRCINCMELIEDGSASCPHCGYQQEGEISPFGIKPNTILKGRYLVGRILGQGGFGITYVGYDLTLAIKVAIKEYFPMGCATRNYTISNQIQWNTTQFSREQWQQGSENFLKEARNMALLDSLPGIVRVKDMFPENQTSYIVMEYIEGENLKQKLQKTGTMQIRDCIKLLTPLMESLAKMHRKRLIHRDISPDNIMIKPDGSACLLDFGAAKDVSFYHQSVVLSQQVVKKGFSPPEQYGAKGNIGPWTDVYALCATIYYCVTGKLVPDAMDRMYEDTLDFSAPVKECMGETVADALRDGLKFRGEERIQTVEELLGRLTNNSPKPDDPQSDDPKPDISQLDSPKQDISQPDVPKPDDSVKKKKWMPILIAAVAGCLVLILIAKAVFSGGGEAQKTSKDDGKASVTQDDTALFAYTLMEDSPEDAVNDIFYGSVLGSNIDRESIVSVTFLDTVKNAPETAWDASWNRDGTVMAWTEQNADKKQYYDLFIGAEGGVKAKDCFRLFTGYYNVEKIAFNDCFDTSKVKNMKSMFYGCENLTELDVSCFDTSAVTDMSFMFESCKKLTTLDVSGFDTSQVTNMSSLFEECNSLSALNVSSFNTSQATDMGWMFYGCNSLMELDVSNFDTSAVTNMRSMFYQCSSLKSLDVSGFNTSQATNMGWMFYGCNSLTELDVSNFDTSAVTNMKSMFYQCSSLKSLDVGSFNTDQVTDASYMFYQCTGLTGIDISNFNIGEETDITGMFDGCSFTAEDAKIRLNKNVLMQESAAQQSDDGIWQGMVLGSDISRDAIATVTFMDTLDKITDNAWDVSWDQDGTVMAWTQKNADNGERYDLFIGAKGGVKGKECSWLFAGYCNVEKIDFNNCFDTSAATSMYAMFYQCENLSSLDLSSFDTGAVTSMAYMFGVCKSLKLLDISGFNTSKVTTMEWMFGTCQSLTSLDVSSFDTSAVTTMNGMFGYCENLESLDVSKFDTSQATDTERMFEECGITAEQAGFQQN